MKHMDIQEIIRNFAEQNLQEEMPLNFIDLFAGAGGLSEGFVRAGYTPIAHIEMDKYACDTLRTRAAYHWLKENDQLQKYKKYL
jgi:DNA (cytosine-5)-methyltransferase 1